MDGEVSKYPELAALKANGSMASFWKYAKKMVVFASLTLEKLFDLHKKEVRELIDKTETGSPEWYLNLCLSYQHGDRLTLENNRPVYLKNDKEKQLVKKASIKEEEGADGNLSLSVKVVKEATGGRFAKLDATELTSFKTYLERCKIVGTKLDVKSRDADRLELVADVVLDATLYESRGKLLSEPAKEPVRAAIEKYIKYLNFGSTLYLSKMTDVVMDVAGVRDFYIRSAKLNGRVFTRSTESPAGHLILENTNLAYVLS